MADGNLVRLGGVFGLLSAIVIIPAYLVGYPDAPGSPAEANSYFDAGAGAFVFFNGVLPLFHVFFFILFLGVLHGALRLAEGAARGESAGGGLSSAALAGGVVFIALSAAGFAAEIVYPATLLRFGGFEPDNQFALVSLALSAWLYHFCQAGASVLIAATSLLALETGALPRWLALAGFVVALLTLLHFLLPLLGALTGLLWIAAVSAVMLAGGVRHTGALRTRVVDR